MAHRDDSGVGNGLDDNASGTAALIELARSYVPTAAAQRISVPYTLVFLSTDGGLLGGIGSLVVRRLSRMPPRIGWVEPPMHIAFAAALAGGAGLLVLSPSVLLLARVGAEGIALLLCLRGIPMVAVFAVLAAGLLPLTGHASTQPEPAGAEFADIIHVLSAAMWGGGILALASLRPPEGWRSADARALVGRFERVAQVAFAVTALTGALRATCGRPLTARC